MKASAARLRAAGEASSLEVAAWHLHSHSASILVGYPLTASAEASVVEVEEEEPGHDQYP